MSDEMQAKVLRVASSVLDSVSTEAGTTVTKLRYGMKDRAKNEVVQFTYKKINLLLRIEKVFSHTPVRAILAV